MLLPWRREVKPDRAATASRGRRPTGREAPRGARAWGARDTPSERA